MGGGPEALQDRPSAPSRVWNRIPADIHDQIIHDQIIEMALEQSELSPRELAVRFTDKTRYFVSEASVYRLLKARLSQPPLINQDHPAQRDVADRLHLLQDHRLGLDVPVDSARRLLALHHRLEALRHHAGRGRHRYAGHGVGCVRMRSGPWVPTNPGCSETMAPATLRGSWRTISRPEA